MGRIISFSTAKKIGFGQIPNEVGIVADIMKNEPMCRIVELGTQRGGNAFFLTQYTSKKAQLVTVDVHPRIHFEMARGNILRKTVLKQRAGKKYRKIMYPFTSSFSRFRVPLIKQFSNKDCKVIPFFTYLKPNVDASVIYHEIFSMKKIDLLFYDADKTDCGVQQNIEAYYPYIRKGGYIVFDDINYRTNSTNGGVARYWRDLDRSRFVKVGTSIPRSEGQMGSIGIAKKI